MKKKREPDEADIRGELEEAFARWNALACGECADPGWEDGANMNLVRNHILYYYRQLEEMGACVRNLFGEIVDERPVPPQVPNNYVVRNGKCQNRWILKEKGRKFIWGRSGEYRARHETHPIQHRHGSRHPEQP